LLVKAIRSVNISTIILAVYGIGAGEGRKRDQSES
jgi:hypothetical protein